MCKTLSINTKIRNYISLADKYFFIFLRNFRKSTKANFIITTFSLSMKLKSLLMFFFQKGK